MEITRILSSSAPIVGGVIGAAGTALHYYKSSNRTVDNIVVPVGGFIAGAQVGGMASDLLGDMPMPNKLASVGVRAVSLVAGVAVYGAWKQESKHTDAGAVGMAFLAVVATDVVLGLVDSVTTKLLPERQF